MRHYVRSIVLLAWLAMLSMACNLGAPANAPSAHHYGPQRWQTQHHDQFTCQRRAVPGESDRTAERGRP